MRERGVGKGDNQGKGEEKGAVSRFPLCTVPPSWFKGAVVSINACVIPSPYAPLSPPSRKQEGGGGGKGENRKCVKSQ